MERLEEWVKKHPAMLAGIAAAIILLFVVIRSRASGSDTTTSGIDPQTAALYGQQQQISAALTGQNASLTAQQNLASIQAQYGIDAATIAANRDITLSNTTAGVQLANIGASADVSKLGIAATLQQALGNQAVQTTGIEAQLAGLEDNNRTSLGLAQTTANEQAHIAELTAGVQSQISHDQTTLGLFQTAGAVNIADTASNNAASVLKSQSNNSLIGGFGGAILGAFL